MPAHAQVTYGPSTDGHAGSWGVVEFARSTTRHRQPDTLRRLSAFTLSLEGALLLRPRVQSRWPVAEVHR